jgi:hypothetical protein
MVGMSTSRSVRLSWQWLQEQWLLPETITPRFLDGAVVGKVTWSLSNSMTAGWTNRSMCFMVTF